MRPGEYETKNLQIRKIYVFKTASKGATEP